MTWHNFVWEGTGGAFFDFFLGRTSEGLDHLGEVYHCILALSIQELGRTTVGGREKG